MKKFFGYAQLVFLFAACVSFGFFAQTLRSLVEPYGYSLGELTGVCVNIALLWFGIALWQVKTGKKSGSYSPQPAVVALDLTGRGTVEEAARKFAAAHTETETIAFFSYVAPAKDGSVDQLEAASDLQKWLRKHIIGRFGKLYVLASGPLPLAMMLGGELANLADLELFAFQGGIYVQVFSVEKKQVRKPRLLTQKPAAETPATPK